MSVSSQTKPGRSLTVASCPNPDCIRCRRYRYVQERAQTKITWLLQDLERKDPSTFSTLNRRIPDAILRPASREEHSKQGMSMQDPTVLMISNLPSKEIVTEWHQSACAHFRVAQTRKIVTEALDCLRERDHGIGNYGIDYERKATTVMDDSDWTINDTSSEGNWRVFHLLNQGVWNPMLISKKNDGNEACKKLFDLIRNTPGLVDNCLFGNAFISNIYPGTHIEPHCGPTNVRHRLQFLLQMPRRNVSEGAYHSEPKLSLLVGNENEIEWDSENSAFVFDDSFIHSVTYSDEGCKNVYRSGQNIVKDEKDQTLDPKSTMARVVLIVDLWHPKLQRAEISLLQHSYPPFQSSTNDG